MRSNDRSIHIIGTIRTHKRAQEEIYLPYSFTTSPFSGSMTIILLLYQILANTKPLKYSSLGINNWDGDKKSIELTVNI